MIEVNNMLISFLFGLNSLEFLTVHRSDSVFRIKNTQFNLVVIRNKMFLTKSGSGYYYKLEEIWDILPEQFKIDAAFNLEIFNETIFVPKWQ